jgi:hypothetical protein
VQVENSADLVPALARAPDSGSTWLIEIRFDPDAGADHRLGPSRLTGA